MAPARNLVQDGRVRWHLIFSPVRGASHEERLESFYSRQAESYDGFRKRLLHGRRELIESLRAPPGGVWVDLRAGTGDNLQWCEDRVGEFSEIHLVDLSESLLGVAQRRIDGDPRYARARAHHADAKRFEFPEGSADLVTFSYSLTMIPDWFAAIDRAWSILKPGGRIGVVDFFVSRKHPLPGDAHHRSGASSGRFRTSAIRAAAQARAMRLRVGSPTRQPRTCRWMRLSRRGSRRALSSERLARRSASGMRATRDKISIGDSLMALDSPEG